MKEVVASLKYIKGSCYKLNVVADLVRGLGVVDADMQLAFCRKRVATIVRKLLKSAVSNAESNFKIAKERLQIISIDVGKAFVLKRSMPRGRGRMTRVGKGYSNIRITLGEKKVSSSVSNRVIK